MYIQELVKQGGLTEGEAKVYLALFELGQTTVGPIIEKSKVARSFIYNVLNGLIRKGLVSYISRERIKYFQAAEPKKILDYIEKQKQELDKGKEVIEKLLPKFENLKRSEKKTEISVYEGFKGMQTAYEHYYDVLNKGEEFICWGNFPTQTEKYHNYWIEDHKKRVKKGIKVRMLFDKDVDDAVLKNRNKFKACDSRRMPVKLKTPAWFLVYKNVVTIILQENPDFEATEDLSVEIKNKEIAETIKAIFEDYWSRAKKFKK